MALTTPRYVLPYPVAADPNNPPADLLALATALDNKMTSFIASTAGTRPAFGLSGRFHFATDTKEVSYDTGSAWRSLTGAPVIPLARYFYTTGTLTAVAAMTVIPWNQTTFNRNGFAAIATPTPKIILPVTGYYRVRAQVRVNGGGGGIGAVAMQIRKGPNSDTAGTVLAYSQRSFNITGTFDNDITCEVETRLQATAADDCAVWVAASPNSVVYASTYETFVEAELVTVT